MRQALFGAFLLTVAAVFMVALPVDGESRLSECFLETLGCLSGLQIKVNYTANTTPCRDTITFTFIKSNPEACDVNTFVFNSAKPESVSACAKDIGARAYNDCAGSAFFYAPWQIPIQEGCNTLTIVVASGGYSTGHIMASGGGGNYDCTTCRIGTYVPIDDTAGACSRDSDCDDGDPCSQDTCDTSGCRVCQYNFPDPFCATCSDENPYRCSDMPFIDSCTTWACNSSGLCEPVKTPDCTPCDESRACPTVGDPATTCIDNVCVNGICEQSTRANCCITVDYTEFATKADACYTCSQKSGCGYTTDEVCVALNGTNSTNTDGVVSDCSVYTVIGDGGDSDGDGGTIAAIVVPIVVVGGTAAAVVAAVVAALAWLLARNMQRGAFAERLQSMGFTEEETNMICNSGLYNGTGEENPLFITMDDKGTRIVVSAAQNPVALE